MSVYDVIIVLGAAIWPDGQPSPTLRRRMAHAVELFDCKVGCYLLLTGGLGRYPPSEAYVMRQLALAAGVPALQIVMEDQARSTFDSALRCARILQQQGWKAALVITDAYHLPRALFTFRAFGIQVAGSAPTGSQWVPRRWKRWYQHYLREALAFVWYGCRIVSWKIRHRVRMG